MAAPPKTAYSSVHQQDMPFRAEGSLRSTISSYGWPKSDQGRDNLFLQEARHEKPRMSLVINGMPNELCNEVCMEAVLQQAGLLNCVETYEALQGDPCGQVLVRLRGGEAVECCVQHFEGMQWHKHVCVSVAISQDEPSEGLRPRKSSGGWSSRRTSRSSWQSSWSKEPVTEDSTEAGVSEHEISDDDLDLAMIEAEAATQFNPWDLNVHGKATVLAGL